jgi:hypothetical protein
MGEYIMIKSFIILIGTIIILFEQIKNLKKERTSRTIFLTLVGVAMVITSIMLFVDEFV